MLVFVLAAILVGGLLLMFLADQSRSLGDTSPVVGMVDGVGQFVLVLVFVAALMLLLF